MGQYFYTVNLDRKEFIHPHRLGDGLKLWEQGASQGGTLNALHALLAISNGKGGGDYIDGHEDFVGRWGGDRIAVVGDYTEAGDLPGVDYAEYIYHACSTPKEKAKEYYPTAKELKAASGPSSRVSGRISATSPGPSCPTSGRSTSATRDGLAARPGPVPSLARGRGRRCGRTW